MISFNEQVLHEEGKFCLQMETDNRRSFELVRKLLCAMVDNQVCTVTVSTEQETVTSGFICADVKK